MYIQITEKCNMLCAHCGFACTAKGQNMSLKTFKKALTHIEEDSMLTIGGGEPTIHPLFWDFLGLAITRCDNVWLATNGKITSIALRLAELARNGIVAVALSQDPWHEKIDSLVVKAFTKGTSEFGDSRNDKREIRRVNRIIKTGRAESNQLDGEEECLCDGDPFVRPNGDVHQCGCLDSPCVGNVFDGFKALDDGDYSEEWACHKRVWKKEETEEKEVEYA